VLVPYQHATADHQTKNALTLEDAGAAACVPDEEVTGIRLAGEVERLLEPETWERMHQAALALARPDAAERIVEQIVSLTGPQPAAKEVVAP
jgi:UDP-N-acetylglucosamine--N-acetylmuramyl-(pentapeptide) pyrophosphoryl-undecaprenol N-acetylglucosamine transferase